MKSFLKVIILSLALAFVFTTCENPVGLGTKVNTEKPVIRNAADGDQPGAFIQGSSNRIWLEVEQEFGIDDVFMDVEFTRKSTGEKENIRVQAYYDQEKGQWYVDLDTTDMVDGKISTWVTAVDVNGNATKTTEIPYFVKNTPPQIKLNMPLVDGDNWDEDVFLENLKNNDPLYLGFELLGLATDDYGIAEGYPKIMIWPAEGPTDLDEDGIPYPTNKLYGSWYSLEVPNVKSGLTATKFSWPMTVLISDGVGGWKLPEKGKGTSLNEGIYRVRIMTKDLFGNENYYPDRTDHGDKQSSKKYIEINYKTSDRPVVQITNVPQYYNGVGNMDVYFTVSSVSPLTDVEAWITDGQDGYEIDNIGGSSPYSVSLVPTSDGGALESEYNSVYKFKYSITPAQAASWSANITALPSGSQAKKGILFIRIKAKAGSKDGLYSYQNFIFDNKPPEVVIDRPVNLLNRIDKQNITGGSYEILYPDNAKPKWVTGSITVGGSAKGNFTSIDKIYYHIGKLDDDKATKAAREAIYANESNWKDTKLDFETPEEGWDGSVYAWTYSFKPFEKDAKETYNGTGFSVGTQKTSDLFNFASNVYSETENDLTHTGRVRFYLPFYVKVVDKAGNFSVLHYKLSVDPLLDEPVVTITQPQITKYIGNVPVPPVVGGTVRIAGYAEDNFWMKTVLVRVKKADSYPVGTIVKDGYYLPTSTTLLYYDSHDEPKPPGNDINGWFEANTIGDSNNINWYANINQDRALDPSDPDGFADVTVEVMAIDCDQTDPTHEKAHMTGPIETLELQFSKKVPGITNPIISKVIDGKEVDGREWVDGIKASGNFKLIFDVDANIEINTLTARINTTMFNLIIETHPQAVPSALQISNSSVPATGKVKRTITINVNSLTNPMPGFSSSGASPIIGYPFGSSGNFTLEVMAEDATDNHLTTTNTFVIGIDNFYPTAEITTSQIASDNPDKGKYYFVSGIAKDYAGNNAQIVQGLNYVLVYIERGRISYPGGTRTVASTNNFLNPYTGGTLPSTDPSETYFLTSYPNVLEAGSSNPSSYNRFPKITYETTQASPEIKAWTSKSALVIDNAEGGAPTGDGDKDGTFGESWDGSSAYREFGARIDFSSNPTNWKDGPYIVHYLVVDQAGNATHYKHDIYLENNKPRITSINFGTDINGAGGVTDGTNGTLNEYLYDPDEGINEPGVSSVAGVMSPSFRIRGNAFHVRLNVEKGNGYKGITLSYVSGSASVNASTMSKGNVYTIDTLGSNMTDFTKYGAPNNVVGTTFVASGPATAGNGTVLTYTLINGVVKTSGNGDKISDSINLGSWTGVNDSDKYVLGDTIPSGLGIGDVKTHNQRSFIVKVYDTTVTDGEPNGEFDQLADAILVKLDIDNNDSKDPTINVLPFGSEYYIDSGATPPLNNPANDAAKKTQDISLADYNKNIGMNGNEKGGYVQYAKHSTPATANVSGKVKFLGKAEDNQKIASIWVTITNYAGSTAGVGSQFQIAQANASTGYLEPIAPTGNYAGQWEFKVLGTKATGNDYYTQDFGHTLNWEFMWDSSKVNNTTGAPGTSNNPVRNNVNITFQVRDAAIPTVHTATSPITVNVVPYISSVETPLSKAYSSTPSAFNRSALGGYPVREGDQITIKGFNFGNNNATVNGTALNPTSTTGGNTITGTVQTSTTSGPLIVSINNGTETITSFNNRSNRNKTGNNWDSPLVAEYNREPNNVNNNILDNSRYMYVWSTGYLILPTGAGGTTGGTGTGFVTPANTRSPFMRVDSTGNRYIVFGWHNGTNSELRVVKNNTNTKVEQDVNRYINNTVAFDSYGDWYAASTNTTSSAQYFFSFYARAAVNDVNANHNRDSRDNKRRLSEVGSNSDRFKIPRIAVMHTAANSTTQGSQNNADRIYMSYYDSDTKELIFHFGTVGNSNQFGQNIATDNNPAKQIVANSSTDNKGSIYSAVGYMSNGRPVIAWYDDTNSCLVFSYGNGTPSNTTYNDDNNIVTTNTTGSNSWQTNARRVTPVGSGQGQHVDLAVDGDNNVHLAYYDVNNGGLYYAYIPSANVVSNTTISTYKVDTYLSAGTKIMLNVRSGVPYITYYHGAFTDTKNSIRVAWRKEALAGVGGTDVENKFTGMWEVMTVPVGTVPLSGEFVCNGVPTANTGWTAALVPDGSALKENNTTLRYTNLSQSILLGYFTQSHYEGAVLKGDMTTTWSTMVGK